MRLIITKSTRYSPSLFGASREIGHSYVVSDTDGNHIFNDTSIDAALDFVRLALTQELRFVKVTP